eukprot:1155321-Pelagomonas_calceolata.AAC.1
MQQRDAQNKQLDELKAKILAERAADKKEGQLLKERAEKVSCKRQISHKLRRPASNPWHTICGGRFCVLWQLCQHTHAQCSSSSIRNQAHTTLTHTQTCLLAYTQEAADLRAKELARIAKSKEHNEATRAANQALQAFKLKELERQKEQERAIEAYSTKKANQM